MNVKQVIKQFAKDRNTEIYVCMVDDKHLESILDIWTAKHVSKYYTIIRYIDVTKFTYDEYNNTLNIYIKATDVKKEIYSFIDQLLTVNDNIDALEKWEL